MKQAIHPSWIANGIFLLCLAAIGRTQAQNVPVPDATLPVNSVVTSEDNISTITGGTVAGSNLFHSFEKFNIDEGQIADFVSPSAAIQNILARVTGSSSSKIMGILGTSGLSNPNLFLINPNGIVFGPNASLEVGGSFVATTANAIDFGNRGFFSASAPNHPGLLTVNPSAFLFNQIAAQPINSIEIGNGAFISAGSLEKPGSLLLVGGNVSPSIAETGKILIGGGILQARGGRVELGGVAGAGTVGLNVDSNNLRLSFPVVGRRADVSITNGAFVNVVGGGGGSITISAQNLDVLEGSELVAGIEKGLESVGTKAGDITLDVIEAMTIANSFISTDVDSEAMGNTGGIHIKAGSLSLTDGAELSASTFGQGEAGGIFVQANNSVSIAGSYIYSDLGFEAVGNTGGIHIKAGSLSLTGAQLSARVSGQGEAGGIFMEANNSVSIARESKIITGLEKTVVGNAGDIHIQAGALSLTDRTELLSSTSGEGRAGNVIIDAQDTVSLENSFISSETFGPGNGGIIDIKARSLSLTEGTELLSRTTGEGAAGTIEINASDSVSISGVNLKEGFSSGLITVSEEEDSGQGGDISVTTGALRVSDGGVLSARTLNASPGGNITVDVKNLEAINGGQLLTTAFSSGRAGNITVNASDSITLSGSDPTYANRLDQFGRKKVDPDSPASALSARTEGTGAAGKLSIETGRLMVRDGAQVSASTSGSGQGGTLSVTAPESVTLSGRGSLSAQATGNGNAGDLTINTLALTVQDRAEVSASTLSGVGGDITLQGLNSLQVSNGGQISASTETGRAGSLNVNANENAADSVQLRGQGSGLFARATGGGDAGGLTINALAFTVADGAEATVSSQEGQAGNLRVTANSIFLGRGRLSAVTAKSQPGTEGANITLQVPDLLLMGNESRISADARGPANGGNINIDTKFLIASPPMGLRGSDIAANAVFGNGGRLNISASGIFGTQFRPEETPLNDITASSEFGLAGVVEINRPDVDPSRGLVNLPAELVDVSGLIAQRCPADVGPVASKFVITGRGGLPPNPSDTLDSDAIQVDWVTLYPGVENSSSPAQATNSTSPTSAPIVEAQGWVIGDNGEVILTAQAPTVTPKSPWQTPAHCHASHNSS